MCSIERDFVKKRKASLKKSRKTRSRSSLKSQVWGLSSLFLAKDFPVYCFLNLLKQKTSKLDLNLVQFNKACCLKREFTSRVNGGKSHVTHFTMGFSCLIWLVENNFLQWLESQDTFYYIGFCFFFFWSFCFFIFFCFKNVPNYFVGFCSKLLQINVCVDCWLQVKTARVKNFAGINFFRLI